jgi:hypothetical protein
MVILDVLGLAGLVVLNLGLLGSYHYDLRQLQARLQEVEDIVKQPIRHTANVSQPAPYEAWLQASEDLDREIVRARERNRS